MKKNGVVTCDPASQGRCQEGSSLCVRPYTKKSLRSPGPLSLSALILNDPISTGKEGDSEGERCGVWRLP